MNTEELEARLEAGQETQSFDIKGPMPWNGKSLVKDILAMANVRDGGTILIGVEDKTFKRLGVPPDDARTYDIDIMRDQMTKFADPHVDFSVSEVEDSNGLVYVVIEVQPFREVPVICRKNDQNAGLKEGAIYYRNSNRRPESAAVSNSYDMRDIITVAAMRTRQRLAALGAVPAPTQDLEVRLDEELNGL